MSGIIPEGCAVGDTAALQAQPTSQGIDVLFDSSGRPLVIPEIVTMDDGMPSTLMVEYCYARDNCWRLSQAGTYHPCGDRLLARH